MIDFMQTILERKKIYFPHPELPTWRYETPEEKLIREKIDPKVARLFIAINEKFTNE